jgi:hypothetical protein
VLNTILEFCNLHHNLCVDTMKEQKARREGIDSRTAAGGWGMSGEEENAREHAAALMVSDSWLARSDSPFIEVFVW